MNQNRLPRIGPVVVLALIAVGVGLAGSPVPGESTTTAQVPASTEQPIELRYVPADAAYFIHADLAAIGTT